MKITASVVPVKTVTQKSITDLRNSGQIKSSVPPLFQSGAITSEIDLVVKMSRTAQKHYLFKPEFMNTKCYALSLKAIDLQVQGEK